MLLFLIFTSKTKTRVDRVKHAFLCRTSHHILPLNATLVVPNFHYVSFEPASTG